jgi:hypothetical protein
MILGRSRIAVYTSPRTDSGGERNCSMSDTRKDGLDHRLSRTCGPSGSPCLMAISGRMLLRL